MLTLMKYHSERFGEFYGKPYENIEEYTKNLIKYENDLVKQSVEKSIERNRRKKGARR